MKKLRIGYVPYSSDLTHPADRRRLVYWARNRGHELVLNLDSNCDVIFETARTDLSHKRRKQSDAPIILDLVDGYLGGEEYWRDWLRGAGKVFTGQLSGPIRPFSQVIESACSSVAAVVCETKEQVKTIDPFCSNVHPILDFHEEFPFLPFNADHAKAKTKSIIWEGLPYTASGLNLLTDFFSLSAKEKSVSLEMVTDLSYPQFLGKYINKPTSGIVKNIESVLGVNFQITEWSRDAVVSAAKRANLAVLPLDPKGFLNPLKAENRLLIMWRLGLPTLASPSSAYIRVMDELGIDGICENENQWTQKTNFLLGSIETQEAMVKAGQQYIRDNHTEEKVLCAWDNLFSSVV